MANSLVTNGAGDLAAVRAIVLDGLRGRAARVWLFGSRARGDARPTSDVDVAVESLDPARPVEPETLAVIRERLAESSVLAAVDLVDLRGAAPAFVRRVRREGVEWTG